MVLRQAFLLACRENRPAVQFHRDAHHTPTAARSLSEDRLEPEPNVEQRLGSLAMRLAGGIKQHASERLEQWFETLPFPLASILRAWQAAPSQDFKTKHEHLLHFFEGTAEFYSVILLSAFNSNEVIFEPHRRKLAAAMLKQNLTFKRATFGTWGLVIEYLGKQTRELLSENGKKPDDAKNDRALARTCLLIRRFH